MREKSPSCIRAPPLTAAPTTGRRCAAAYSNVRVMRSPTAVPMLPIIKYGSIIKTVQAAPPIDAVPQTTASVSRLEARVVSSFSA